MLVSRALRRPPPPPPTICRRAADARLNQKEFGVTQNTVDTLVLLVNTTLNVRLLVSIYLVNCRLCS